MTNAVNDRLIAAGRLDSAYLESLFHGAGFAIVACEPNGRIVASNAAAARVFGDERCIAGGPVSALFREDDRARVEEAFDNCLGMLETVELNVRVGGSDADPIEYAVLLTPVLEPDGTIRGVSLWFRDITKRQRLQRALDKRERLASLGTLSGAVAHHYNNLLCCIATSVEYAINMNTMTAMRRALQRTADAVSRAANITRQLLAFAQADRRSTDLADLTETVYYFLDENEKRLAEQHIRLFEDIQRIPMTPIRRDQLSVVLGNIVDNAIEAMPGGGTLSVTLARRDDRSVCLSITDTGSGVRPQDMERLFEPFYTTKGELGDGKGRNAGMGLAVAHGLIAEMGGTIGASNVAGRGARFDIVLPLDPAE